MMSIRSFLITTLVLSISLIYAFFFAYSYYETRHEIDELFDAELAQRAKILGMLSHGVLPEKEKSWEVHIIDDLPNDASSFYGHGYEKQIAFQFFDFSRRLLGRSENAPEQALSELAPGFGFIQEESKNWRTFVYYDEKGVWVVAAEDQAVRKELASELISVGFVPFLIVMPLSILLIIVLVNKGLLPLMELRRKIALLDVQELKPIVLTKTSKEVESVSNAVNYFIDLVVAGLARERRFTADVAHELRTPLTILKLHADNALHAQDEKEKNNALKALPIGIERLIRLVQQMLMLSRLDAWQAEKCSELKSTCNLHNLVAERMAQLIPIADKRNIELELIAQADVQWDIAIVPEWIEVLVDNLIGNAIHYGPSDALIQVHLNIENTVDKGEVIQLEISDLGAGIVEREPVFERFYRGKAHNEQARADHKKNGDGVGLGLSIVQKIVHLHGGQVSICPRSSTTPFSMRVQLPKEGKIESPLFDKA